MNEENENGKHGLERQQDYITQILHGCSCVQWKWQPLIFREMREGRLERKTATP